MLSVTIGENRHLLGALVNHIENSVCISTITWTQPLLDANNCLLYFHWMKLKTERSPDSDVCTAAQELSKIIVPLLFKAGMNDSEVKSSPLFCILILFVVVMVVQLWFLLTSQALEFRCFWIPHTFDLHFEFCHLDGKKFLLTEHSNWSSLQKNKGFNRMKRWEAHQNPSLLRS